MNEIGKFESTISVIMPAYNGETTIKQTLESLARQTKKYDELVIVNDASDDRSVEHAKLFLSDGGKYKLVENKKRIGLAATYNEGIRATTGDLIITLHQDILLENDALEKLVEPFRDPTVVAATHQVSHPIEIWKNYNFWQKCFFARFAGKTQSGIDGKFDAFRKNALEKVGLFDEMHFRTAGEDGDMVWKLKKIGKIVFTKAKIVHLHKIDPNFSWKNIVYKQAQYSQAQGALLAQGRIWGIKSLAKTFFRETLLIFLFIPFLNIVALVLIIAYSFIYTRLMYMKEFKDPRIMLLPFFNICLLFVSFFCSLQGFISKKQTI